MIPSAEMVYSLLVCLPVALSDEGHQLLVPGRGGQMRDVWIDSAGAILGIGLFFRRARHP